MSSRKGGNGEGHSRLRLGTVSTDRLVESWTKQPLQDGQVVARAGMGGVEMNTLE